MQYHFIDGNEYRGRFFPNLRVAPFLLHTLVDQHLIIDFASGRALLLQGGYVDCLLEVGECIHVLHQA